MVKTEGSIQTTLLIDATKFCSFRRLIGCVARIFRFVNKCRTKRASRAVSQELTTKELMNARVLMIKAVQEDMKNEPEFESWVRDLSVYQHQDVKGD